MIETLLCEGGDKGEKIETVIKEAYSEFFFLGVKNIEKECNRLRECYLKKWKQKDPKAKIISPKTGNEISDITYEKAIYEATPEFQLKEPEKIYLYIHEKIRPPFDKNDVPMLVSPYNEKLNKLSLHVLLTKFEYRNDLFFAKQVNMYVNPCTYHELIHCCGDADFLNPLLRNKCNIVRHTWIGTKAVENLLQQK